jgi:hypothetical protein
MSGEPRPGARPVTEAERAKLASNAKQWLVIGCIVLVVAASALIAERFGALHLTGGLRKTAYGNLALGMLGLAIGLTGWRRYRPK